jgi:hypothetical protein
LSISVPHTGHVFPPHSACRIDVGRRKVGNVVLPHFGQETGSILIPQRFLVNVPTIVSMVLIVHRPKKIRKNIIMKVTTSNIAIV